MKLVVTAINAVNDTIDVAVCKADSGGFAKLHVPHGGVNVGAVFDVNVEYWGWAKPAEGEPVWNDETAEYEKASKPKRVKHADG